MRARIASILPALLLVAAIGCSTHTSGPGMGRVDVKMTATGATTAATAVAVTAATPAGSEIPDSSLDAVNLVVTEIAIHRSGGGDDEGDGEFDDDSTQAGDHGDGDVDDDSTDVDDHHEGDSTDVEDHHGDGGWEVLSTESRTVDVLTLRNGVITTLALGTVPAGHYTQLRLVLGDGSTVVIDGAEHPLVVPSGQQTGVKLVGGFDVPVDGTVEITLDFDTARSIRAMPDGSYRLQPTIKVVHGD
jgi:hypothetical protein